MIARSWAGAWLLTLTTLLAPGVASGAPSMRLGPDPIVATPDGYWRFTLSVLNSLPVGYYLDSLIVEIADQDPGETGLPRSVRRDMTRLASGFAPIGAGDSANIMLSLPSTFEQGRLSVRWYGHEGAGTRYPLAASVALAPDSALAAVVSRAMVVAGRQVEWIGLPPTGGVSQAPGVLLLHDHGEHARSLLRLATSLRAQGIGVVLVSQLGYGRSEGPPDLMGPGSVAAASAGLDSLRRLPGVDPRRCVVWGVSRGATLALLLAAERPRDVAGVISQAGLYDVQTLSRLEPARGTHSGSAAGTERDSTAWAARSPREQAARIHAPVLLAHARADANSPIAAARSLAGALQANGARVDTLFTPGGRQMPSVQLERAAVAFILGLVTR